ncbi:hypothetical protein A3B02_01055 [Candidatus Roizmanbacteria bacterium RIFCSPLOWO2_01_FULL_42_14]|uniref:Uncharacterized protein n=3 Tax=Candidatus Roizmaniibacteriota TaxID=1752723 RepID=A0A1F7JT95_9BACT|nr:MAG: hypothetical protein A3D08_03390 [Candidatus Roizmanbacteria bacterium RIFCSPHIGHO2_02_FULL_43_11]OGK52438.1 MAG: hypothetical protein A3B02_01055 [Candidatus Roizmanbacteria bacterium RIFCSPLOWO2_01_FULL_42_14]OGK58826.1 MAG: hypothetical protein A3I56_03635 [Candidatus Roizmanbacteria bacterium RIFCSPLOWO2_02_FULL_43_10]
MAKNFRIGQSSLEVSQIIIEDHPEVIKLKLISHKVEENWRQVNHTSLLKSENILKGFNHDKPTKEVFYNRNEFLDLNLKKLEKLSINEVWSLTSKVLCTGNIYKHIPMMNLHSENVDFGTIKKSLRYICGKKSGYLLDSGRFLHYYGNFLLTHNEWIKFMAEFLMPCIIVSPRYIGHRLNDGYCTLRLTTEKLYKPKLPEVICQI